MMCADTGRWLSLEDHVYQSIEKIIFTTIGTRIMRRAFGTILPELIDGTPTLSTLGMARAGIATGIARFERRYQTTRLVLTPREGTLDIELAGFINDKPVQFAYAYTAGANS